MNFCFALLNVVPQRSKVHRKPLPKSRCLRDMLPPMTKGPHIPSTSRTASASSSLAATEQKMQPGCSAKKECEINECDIGLHFDDIHKLSEGEKFNFIKNLWKPDSAYEFPKTRFGTRHMSCNKKWFLLLLTKYFVFVA